ncbi:hypothetical protein [Trichlorobacter ammonificans]|uniref:Uncharacterized protein n=1 Tax=Trichlorobacter ammonificans TaxID=2916410 RepID=A0ABM9DDQ1_9BACT|nr:hypothetical protein [Trichlorobacter ammonificans]CAH2032602.1 conserved protein of unknown function [Trichlorobacter ammonificans]
MRVDAASSLLQSTLSVPLVSQPLSVQKEVSASGENPASPPRTPSAVADGGGAEQVSVNITVPKQTIETLEKIGSVTELLNSTAKSLRETGTSLKLSSDMIAQMKEQLGKIVKNFPPFPPESAERRDILMSYQAIREQINQMTVPPPPAPVYERVAYLWHDLFPTGRRSSVNTPELSPTATDSQVKQAEEQLTFTRAAVTQLRESIGASL